MERIPGKISVKLLEGKIKPKLSLAHIFQRKHFPTEVIWHKFARSSNTIEPRQERKAQMKTGKRGFLTPFSRHSRETAGEVRMLEANTPTALLFPKHFAAGMVRTLSTNRGQSLW